jgi:hypothetical protein
MPATDDEPADEAENRDHEQLGTVKRHRVDILHRLGMRDGVDLTHYAIRSGLIEP